MMMDEESNILRFQLAELLVALFSNVVKLVLKGGGMRSRYLDLLTRRMLDHDQYSLRVLPCRHGVQNLQAMMSFTSTVIHCLFLSTYNLTPARDNYR